METKRIFAWTAGLVAAGCFLVGGWGIASADEAKDLYDKNCTSCHGAGGKGDGAAGKFLNPKPGDFSVVLKGKADADLAKTIAEGGKAVGKSALMPAFKSKLTDAQIQGMVGYVKGLAAK